jgi:hypothetical protein
MGDFQHPLLVFECALGDKTLRTVTRHVYRIIASVTLRTPQDVDTFCYEHGATRIGDCVARSALYLATSDSPSSRLGCSVLVDAATAQKHALPMQSFGPRYSAV